MNIFCQIIRVKRQAEEDEKHQEMLRLKKKIQKNKQKNKSNPHHNSSISSEVAFLILEASLCLLINVLVLTVLTCLMKSSFEWSSWLALASIIATVLTLHHRVVICYLKKHHPRIMLYVLKFFKPIVIVVMFMVSWVKNSEEA